MPIFLLMTLYTYHLSLGSQIQACWAIFSLFWARFPVENKWNTYGSDKRCEVTFQLALRLPVGLQQHAGHADSVQPVHCRHFLRIQNRSQSKLLCTTSGSLSKGSMSVTQMHLSGKCEIIGANNCATNGPKELTFKKKILKTPLCVIWCHIHCGQNELEHPCMCTLCRPSVWLCPPPKGDRARGRRRAPFRPSASALHGLGTALHHLKQCGHRLLNGPFFTADI